MSLTKTVLVRNIIDWVKEVNVQQQISGLVSFLGNLTSWMSVMFSTRWLADDFLCSLYHLLRIIHVLSHKQMAPALKFIITLLWSLSLVFLTYFLIVMS